MPDELQPLTPELRDAIIDALESAIAPPRSQWCENQMSLLRSVTPEEADAAMPGSQYEGSLRRQAYLLAALNRGGLSRQLHAWLQQILAEESL